jgi:hypothetical protein
MRHVDVSQAHARERRLDRYRLRRIVKNLSQIDHILCPSQNGWFD